MWSFLKKKERPNPFLLAVLKLLEEDYVPELLSDEEEDTRDEEVPFIKYVDESAKIFLASSYKFKQGAWADISEMEYNSVLALIKYCRIAAALSEGIGELVDTKIADNGKRLDFYCSVSEREIVEKMELYYSGSADRFGRLLKEMMPERTDAHYDEDANNF